MTDDINAPMIPTRILDANGNLTPQAYEFFRRLWSRTGYAPGVSSGLTAGAAADAAEMASIAVLSGISARAQFEAENARDDASAFALMVSNTAALHAKAEEALSAAMLALGRSQALEARAQKILDEAQSSAILSLTARKRDGSFSDESMALAMTRPWPSQPKSS